MAKPLFRIVIPTYNRQDPVTYAIESVIQQTSRSNSLSPRIGSI